MLTTDVLTRLVSGVAGVEPIKLAALATALESLTDDEVAALLAGITPELEADEGDREELRVLRMEFAALRRRSAKNLDEARNLRAELDAARRSMRALRQRRPGFPALPDHDG